MQAMLPTTQRDDVYGAAGRVVRQAVTELVEVHQPPIEATIITIFSVGGGSLEPV